MEETVIVMMLKDKKTGFLEKELGCYHLGEQQNMVFNIYAEQLSWQWGEEKPSPLTSPFRIQAGRCSLRPNAWVRQSAGVQDPGT